MSIWFWQMNGREVRVIDFYGNNSFGLDHYFKVLADRPYRYETDWLPPDARARETIAGRSRVEHFAISRRFPRIVPEHKVSDRINAGRLLFPRCVFDKIRCAEGLEALRQYHTEFDEQTRTFTDRPEKNWASHPADAYGHMAMAWRELVADPEPKDPIKELLRPKTWDEVWKRDDDEDAA